MRITVAIAFVIFASSCSLCCCLEEAHLVPKVGLESKYALKNRDLSTAGMEHYLYGSEMMDKAHLAEGKEGEMKYLEKSLPVEHEYMLKKDGHEIKTDIGLEEKEMMAFLAKIKELGGGKMLEEEYKKGMYYGAPEEKFLSEKGYLAEDPAKKEMSKKIYDEALKSKEVYGLGEAYGFEMDKAIRESKAHGLGAEAGKAYHGIAEEEAMKSKKEHGLTYDYEMDKGIYGSKAHGLGAEVGLGIEKSIHGIAGEEALKSKEVHGLAYDFELEKGMPGAKAHGLGEVGFGFEKSMHGIAGEEALKSKGAHGLAYDFEMDKKLHGAEAAFGDEMKHSIGHGIHSPFAAEAGKAFKIYEDELVKKDGAYGADALFHKDKEILGSSADHYLHGMLKDEEAKKFYEATADKHIIGTKDGIIGEEKSHLSFDGAKAKFFELLRRVFQTRKCHLVTMSARELLSIVNCISISKYFINILQIIFDLLISNP